MVARIQIWLLGYKYGYKYDYGMSMALVHDEYLAGTSAAVSRVRRCMLPYLPTSPGKVEVHSEAL